MEPLIRSGKISFSSCRQSFQRCVLFQRSFQHVLSSWWHLELSLPGSVSRANLHSRWEIQRRLSWRVPFQNQVSRSKELILSHHLCNILYLLMDSMYCMRSQQIMTKHAEEEEAGDRKRLDASDRNKIREELQKHTTRIFADPEDRLSNIMEQLHPRKWT